MLEHVQDGVTLEEVREGIFSALPQCERESDYDGKARLYDAVVGNRFYNRLIWGNWPSDYARFCRDCLDTHPDGTVIDAGCGSLVFTAKAIAESKHKSIVLLDRSLGMLERGRQRMKRICGRVPENLSFVQGDIFNLPFRDASFDVAMLQGVLHLFDDKESVLAELERVRKESGVVSFSSLVANNRLGRKYLSALERTGEVARVDSTDTLSRLLKASSFSYDLTSIGNMVYARSV